jgi:hypothetical protein
MALPAAFDGFVEQGKRVSPTCLITFERNRYSVPASFANRPVSLRIYPERLLWLPPVMQEVSDPLGVIECGLLSGL